jgi:hypothetical protein
MTVRQCTMYKARSETLLPVALGWPAASMIVKVEEVDWREPSKTPREGRLFKASSAVSKCNTKIATGSKSCEIEITFEDDRDIGFRIGGSASKCWECGSGDLDDVMDDGGALEHANGEDEKGSSEYAKCSDERANVGHFVVFTGARLPQSQLGVRVDEMDWRQESEVWV